MGREMAEAVKSLRRAYKESLEQLGMDIVLGCDVLVEEDRLKAVGARAEYWCLYGEYCKMRGIVNRRVWPMSHSSS